MSDKPISKRRMQSLLRAEAVAQELRYQFSAHLNWDSLRLSDHLQNWMRVTGKQKYERPAPAPKLTPR